MLKATPALHKTPLKMMFMTSMQSFCLLDWKAIEADAQLSAMAVAMFVTPLGLPRNLGISGLVECSSAILGQLVQDFLRDGGKAVGTEIVDIAIRTRDAHVGSSGCALEVSVGDQIVSGDVAWNWWENGGLRSGIAVGRRVFIRLRDALPLGMGRLHDLGIEDEISVDFVDAGIVVTTLCSQSRIVLAGLG